MNLNQSLAICLILYLLCGPFLWMGFKCLKAAEPLIGDILVFTTKFPVKILELIWLTSEGSKSESKFGATKWFWTLEWGSSALSTRLLIPQLFKQNLMIWPCMEYCCHALNAVFHAWNIVDISGLVPVAATWNCRISCKKQICRTIGPSLAASLEPMAHCWNVASLILFYRYYGRYSSELAELVPLLSFVLGVTRKSMTTVSFLVQWGHGILCYGMLSFDLWSKWL